jgi:hypothetical protein
MSDLDVVEGILIRLTRAGLVPQERVDHAVTGTTLFRYRMSGLRWLDLAINETCRWWDLDIWTEGNPVVRLAAGDNFSGRGWRELLFKDIVSRALPMVAKVVAQNALVWREQGPVARAVLPEGSDHRHGWDFNLEERSVYRAWTTKTTNGIGWPKDYRDQGSVQPGGQALFTSRDDAITALRMAVQERAGILLHLLDAAMGGEELELHIRPTIPGRGWL